MLSGQDSIISRSLWKRLRRFNDFFVSISILVIGSLWIFYSERLPIHPSCLMKTLSGVPCPGCGGTRAVSALLHGDVFNAIYINPLSLLVFIFFCIAPIWTFIDGIRNKRTLYNVLTKRISMSWIIIFSVIIVLNWIWNIIKGI